jgi:hypothetical protein
MATHAEHLSAPKSNNRGSAFSLIATFATGSGFLLFCAEFFLCFAKSIAIIATVKIVSITIFLTNPPFLQLHEHVVDGDSVLLLLLSLILSIIFSYSYI